MVDRINLILKAKNITARQFAEEIGIQPSGMSHILSGRNRPSLDFVMKVVTRYPEIDIKWLTLGVGEMFVAPSSMPVAIDASQRQQTPLPTPKPVFDEQESPKTEKSEIREMDLFSQPSYEPVSQEQVSVNTDDKPKEALLFKDEEADEDSSPAAVETSDPIVDKERQEAKEDSTYYNNVKKDELDENRVNEFVKPTVVEKRNVEKKRISKIIVFYEDHSFSEYYPE